MTHDHGARTIPRDSVAEDLIRQLDPDTMIRDISWMELADCVISGPRSAADAEELLASWPAVCHLQQAWATECPNLSLLAMAASPEADQDETGDGLVYLTRELLTLVHASGCSRCRRVLTALARNEPLRSRILQISPGSWASQRGPGIASDPEFPWNVTAEGDVVSVWGPIALDGHPVVVLDPTRAHEPIQLLHPGPHTNRVSSVIECSHPEGLEVHHADQLNSPWTQPDIEWLATALEPVARPAMRGTAPGLDQSTHLGGSIRGGVRALVHSRPRKGMWTIELEGLTPRANYEIVLAWADGISPAVPLTPASPVAAVRVPDPRYAGQPTELRLRVLRPAA
jgi:hypothetical protein